MLLHSPPPADQVFDLCVIGAGPVGLSLALEAGRLGMRVLLLEEGPATPSKSADTDRDLRVTAVNDPGHHSDLGETTHRGLGGTSWLWGGRCVPFEPVDFEVRSYAPNSGWPITSADVSPWQGRAAAYLDCGPAVFHSEQPDWGGLGPILVTQQERWSRNPRRGLDLGSRVLAHSSISVLCDTMAFDLVTDAEGTSVTHVRARHEGRECLLRARAYSLAGGGLKTTRLLLNVQSRLPGLVGNQALGRYYAGHLTGSIANIVLASPDDFSALDFHVDGDGTFVRRRLTVSASGQREERLLNTSFYPGNPPFQDHRHRNGALSALFLALSLPLVGRRLASEDTRSRNARSGRQYGRHIANIARQPVRSAGDLTRIVRRRMLSSSRMKVFVVPNRTGLYALRYHAEQTSSAANRVRLNRTTEADGLRGIDVTFRYSTQDVDSLLRAHALLDDRLQASGRGHLEYHHPPEERAAAVRAQDKNGYHQIGTTRMSDDPRAGVVDAQCRVHGTTNLFVASSSVFPTAGEANPTFMAVCLAVRLAHQVAGEQSRISHQVDVGVTVPTD